MIRAIAKQLPAANQKALEKAATQFEAYFLRRMLAEVRGSTGGKDSLFGGGIAGGMFKEMLHEALSDSMAKAGGVGIAGNLMQELGGMVRKGRISARLVGGRAPVQPTRASGAIAGYGKQSGSELSVVPLQGRRTSRFGTRSDPFHRKTSYHSGLDIAAPTGTPVRSAGAGVVVQAGKRGGYGNLVVVDHGNGVRTRYGHLNEIGVRKGDRLAAGAEVGTVGMTGRATGPHLHLEVRRNGKAVDPAKEIPGLAKKRNR